MVPMALFNMIDCKKKKKKGKGRIKINQDVEESKLGTWNSGVSQ